MRAPCDVDMSRQLSVTSHQQKKMKISHRWAQRKRKKIETTDYADLRKEFYATKEHEERRMR
jgi:hypothetical protein